MSDLNLLSHSSLFSYFGTLVGMKKKKKILEWSRSVVELIQYTESLPSSTGVKLCLTLKF